MNVSPATPFELSDLVAEFYSAADWLGHVTPCAADEVPEPFRHLLAHNHHMTVTVEQFHKCPVDVRVLQHRQRTSPQEEIWYSREILLVCQNNQKIVQYGIVRIRMDRLPGAVRNEIESRQKPLGRVLIEHGVLRQVKLGQLFRIQPSSELQQRLVGERSGDFRSSQVCYARTAQIIVDGESAIDLFELIPPLD